jgi:hypothetical protein
MFTTTNSSIPQNTNKIVSQIDTAIDSFKELTIKYGDMLKKLKIIQSGAVAEDKSGATTNTGHIIDRIPIIQGIYHLTMEEEKKQKNTLLIWADTLFAEIDRRKKLITTAMRLSKFLDSPTVLDHIRAVTEYDYVLTCIYYIIDTPLIVRNEILHCLFAMKANHMTVVAQQLSADGTSSSVTTHESVQSYTTVNHHIIRAKLEMNTKLLNDRAMKKQQILKYLEEGGLDNIMKAAQIAIIPYPQDTMVEFQQLCPKQFEIHQKLTKMLMEIDINHY